MTARLYPGAWEGMRETLGEAHVETLISLEDLAVGHLRYEVDANDPLRSKHLPKSLQDMAYVYEQRKKILGKEHPYTLLSTLHIARLKSALGQHEEAECLIREGLEVADSNIDPKHIALTMARTIYAEVLTHLRRYAEAEALFLTLVVKERYAQLADEDGDHPDRISALWFFVRCLEEQGKCREALERSEEFVAAMAAIGGQNMGAKHVILPKMRDTVARLKEKLDARE